MHSLMLFCMRGIVGAMLFFKNNKRKTDIDRENLPSHIAIIMDGNGRWAKKRGLPRTAGHAAGSETFRRIATYCNDIGIKYLSVYAFSTENWKRPKEEVDAIMGLLEKYLIEAYDSVIKDNIRLTFWGEKSALSEKLQAMIDEVEERSREMTGLHVNVCLNYGGRDEITRAVKKLANKAVSGQIKIEDIDENMISENLYSSKVPDPELIIRPSGEIRVSNFLLWQSAYSEYYFTDVLWPDFTPKELDRAILTYQGRNRRFGGV